MARWEALPEAERSAIETLVRASDPVVAAIPPVFRALCLEAMSRAPATPAPFAAVEVEVLPTDRELRSATLLLDADDPVMRLSAARQLFAWGRGDLVRERVESAGKQTGRRPPKVPPAGERSSCRPPG